MPSSAPSAAARQHRSRRAAVANAGRAALLALLCASAVGAAESPPLVDRTAEAGLDFLHFNGMSGELYFAENMGSGAALLDYDGDGDLDAYLVQGAMLGEKPIEEATFAPRHPLPLTDRLYRNDPQPGPDGTLRPRFVDVTEASGVFAPGYGMGVAAGDVDNDGWVDLYVTNLGPNQLLRNNGDGTFRDVTAASGAEVRQWSVSASFVDFDRDGWLDLFVVNYVDFRVATHKPCASATGEVNYCGPLAYNPEPDVLLRNRGDGTFEDVSQRAGIAKEFGAGLGVITADFNGDGWPDVYVANDQTPNLMWINAGDGTFVNDALVAGTAYNEQGLPEASMGIVAGDLDGNGSEDLFMTHIDRETNTVYLNDGTGLFRDSARESGLGAPSFMYTGFGTALFDYDGDGWLDIFVANGAVQQLEPLVRAGDPYPLHQRNQLFRNRGGGRFEEVAAERAPVLAVSEVSRGVAAGDLDHDGDPDLLMSNNAGPARLFINQVGQDRPWLALRLLEAGAARDATGARVEVRRGADRPSLWRRVAADGSYASANDPWLTVGLGEAAAADGLRITWPDGGAVELRGVPTGRRLLMRPGGKRPAS